MRVEEIPPNDSQARQNLETRFGSDLANWIGQPASRVLVLDVRPGSLESEERRAIRTQLAAERAERVAERKRREESAPGSGGNLEGEPEASAAEVTALLLDDTVAFDFELLPAPSNAVPSPVELYVSVTEKVESGSAAGGLLSDIEPQASLAAMLSKGPQRRSLGDRAEEVRRKLSHSSGPSLRPPGRLRILAPKKKNKPTPHAADGEQEVAWGGDRDGWRLFPKFPIADVRNPQAEIFDDIYRELRASGCSHIARQDKAAQGLAGPSATSFVEIAYNSLSELLSLTVGLLRAGSWPTGKFIDLGSRSGRAVVAAALLGKFEECCGFEPRLGLYTISDGVRRHYDAAPRVEMPFQILEGGEGAVQLFKSKVSFKNIEPMETDWSDALTVLAITTLYTDEEMGVLAEDAAKLAPGAVLVTATRPVKSDAFVLKTVHRVATNSGTVAMYLQQRVSI